MTTAAKSSLIVLMLLIATSTLQGSGLVGIYAIVSKVVFEPNDKAPERIQIWGAFTLVDGGTGRGGKTLTPQRGYMYFSLPGTGNFGTDNRGQKEAALKEWADFKAIAGTGQVVAFGTFSYIGVFSDELISRPAGVPPYVLMVPGSGNSMQLQSKNPIRQDSIAPTAPDSYPVSMGLTKLSSTGDLAAVVNQLQQALKR
jgi:hypothetical protein